MEESDIAIIGAGAVGLAIAKELSASQKEVVLLEKARTFGQETSSRNSEVIHGGMYYPKGTLKARLCVEGRRILYGICKEYNIPHRKTGKLIVAVEKEELTELENLLRQGKENGVEGLSLIDKSALKQMEPNVFALFALYSPETGIIDSHQLMQFYLDYAKERGVLAAFNSEVIAIDKDDSGYKIIVRDNSETLSIKARVVINSSGLDSDVIAAMVGLKTNRLKYTLHYCKGNYFRVRAGGANSINRLIYPVPKPKGGGLGIHATLDLAGGLKLGPDDTYLKKRIKDYTVDAGKLPAFCASVKKFIPSLKEDELFPDTCGIRPKLQGEGEDYRDFVIQEESGNGLPGFINLIGIESPGLTASIAIAKFVKGLVLNCYNN